MILRARDSFSVRIRLGTLAAASIIGLCSAGAVSAKVFASQEQALSEAFPEATRFDRQTIILRKEDAAKIRAITHEKVQSKVIVLHTAYREDELLGYAHIDVHNVRTKPEALMIVLDPTGTVRSVRVLAFHEPLDYLPGNRWYLQLVGTSLRDRLRVGQDIHGVAGATLSARAATDGVRRMLAYWQVLLRPTEVIPEAP